ncbi:MAG: CTP synthase, partial [Thermoanaerobaculia bacterium]|nr:CTP synthase [Thermoanaerobaculia bacterium]
RHRYEVNQKYLGALREHGMVISGLSPDGKFVEIVELKDHPWFFGCQFHPEYRSRPTDPHPIFKSFIEAACTYQDQRKALQASSKEAESAVGSELEKVQ